MDEKFNVEQKVAELAKYLRTRGTNFVILVEEKGVKGQTSVSSPSKLVRVSKIARELFQLN